VIAFFAARLAVRYGQIWSEFMTLLGGHSPVSVLTRMGRGTSRAFLVVWCSRRNARSRCGDGRRPCWPGRGDRV